jgi:hypothetical protein
MPLQPRPIIDLIPRLGREFISVLASIRLGRTGPEVSDELLVQICIRHLVAYPPDTRNLTSGAGDVLIRLVPVALACSSAGFR